MTREQARQYFRDKGLTYKHIFIGDICCLEIFLQEELKEYLRQGNEDVKRKNLNLAAMAKNDIKMDKEALRFAYLSVQASNFESREAISFNLDGSIGFAGWADEETVQPILKAFIRWCDFMEGA